MPTKLPVSTKKVNVKELPISTQKALVIVTLRMVLGSELSPFFQTIEKCNNYLDFSVFISNLNQGHLLTKEHANDILEILAKCHHPGNAIAALATLSDKRDYFSFIKIVLLNKPHAEGLLQIMKFFEELNMTSSNEPCLQNFHMTSLNKPWLQSFYQDVSSSEGLLLFSRIFPLTYASPEHLQNAILYRDIFNKPQIISLLNELPIKLITDTDTQNILDACFNNKPLEEALFSLKEELQNRKESILSDALEFLTFFSKRPAPLDPKIEEALKFLSACSLNDDYSLERKDDQIKVFVQRTNENGRNSISRKIALLCTIKLNTEDENLSWSVKQNGAEQLTGSKTSNYRYLSEFIPKESMSKLINHYQFPGQQPAPICSRFGR